MAAGPGDLRTPLPTRILKAYIEPLTGFSHIFSPDVDSVNSTLSLGCVLENSSHCGNSGQSVYSKDGGGGVTAWLQLESQLAGTSARWPPPTASHESWEICTLPKSSCKVFLKPALDALHCTGNPLLHMGEKNLDFWQREEP